MNDQRVEQETDWWTSATLYQFAVVKRDLCVKTEVDDFQVILHSKAVSYDRKNDIMDTSFL